MQMGKKQFILFGAGDEGKKLLSHLGAERVFCFADNNKEKVDTEILGKRVISFSELLKIHRNYRVVVAVSTRYRGKLWRQLFVHGCFWPMTLTKAYRLAVRPKNLQLLALKNSHRGERCFVIGMGPSLRISDLDRLHRAGVFCLSCNLAFKAFPQTQWRPNLYVAIDHLIVYQFLEEILKSGSEHIFLNKHFYLSEAIQGLPPIDLTTLERENVHLINIYRPNKNTYKAPKFSKQCERYFSHGSTVSYAMIQLAAYMGFKEIYLLGIDHNYSAWNGGSSKVQDHFIKDYNTQGTRKGQPSEQGRVISINAYKSARRAAFWGGFKIYNATRGGKLEEFKRVDFDSLYPEQPEQDS